MLMIGGIAFYDVLAGIRKDIQRASAIANENMSLTLDAFKLSLEKMNNEISGLKDLSGIKRLEQSQSRLEFAHLVIDLIQESGGEIGTDGLIGSKIDSPVAAMKWAGGARDEARIISYKARDLNEVIWSLSTSITRQDWLIQFGDAKPIPLYDWIVTHEKIKGYSLTSSSS